jgi:predicted alpha/beta-fold hydrolase
MPIISKSTYKPPLFFSNGHTQSIFPTLFRKVAGINYKRERINTPDDDFLDLDWSTVRSNHVGIISHGLEGNSMRHYVLGMAKILNKNGYDAIGWNFRSCSGEPNKKIYSYHSGASNDLHTVVSHVISKNIYTEIILIGFSMGGNVTLKYLGEQGEKINAKIKKAITFSVPTDLKSSAIKMAKLSNKIYMKRFLKMLHEKIKQKMEIMPGQIDDKGYEKIKNFKDFDDRYTAPLNGFKDAEDYWKKSSCKQFLHNIVIPTLLVNAENDPILANECYPIDEAKKNPNLFLEIPKSGGHVGFISFNNDGYWSELRTILFINELK